MLSLCLGLDLQRRQEPNQGVQKQIDLFGAAERVSFPNTFAARALQDRIRSEVSPIEISRDRGAGEVHALRGPRFASYNSTRIGADPRGPASSPTCCATLVDSGP